MLVEENNNGNKFNFKKILTIGGAAGIILLGIVGIRTMTSDKDKEKEAEPVKIENTERYQKPVVEAEPYVAPVPTAEDTLYSKIDQDVLRIGEDASWSLQAQADSMVAKDATPDSKSNPRGTLGQNFPALLEQFQKKYSGSAYKVSGTIEIAVDEDDAPAVNTTVMVTDSLDRQTFFTNGELDEQKTDHVINDLLTDATEKQLEKADKEAANIGQQAAWHIKSLAYSIEAKGGDVDKRPLAFPGIAESVKKKFSTSAVKVSATMYQTTEQDGQDDDGNTLYTKKIETQIKVTDKYGRKTTFTNGVAD